MSAPEPILNPIAHLREGAEEPLELHMLEVAIRAEEFATHFDADDWGRVLGAWHDLGKYRIGFQRHIRGEDVPRSVSTGSSLSQPPITTGSMKAIQQSAIWSLPSRTSDKVSGVIWVLVPLEVT